MTVYFYQRKNKRKINIREEIYSLKMSIVKKFLVSRIKLQGK